MLRHLYSLCFSLLLPLILLRLLWRSIKAPDYRKRWAERFGFFNTPGLSGPCVWLHCVSVGETIAAIPLIKTLLEQHPNKTLVITSITPTGSARVRETFANEIESRKVFHVYAPYDLPWAVRAFLKRIRPLALIIMETELWPNMISACYQQNIPVVLANGRLSQKSAKGYQKTGGLITEIMHELHCVAAQYEPDGENFLRLGLDRQKLQVTGSIKFDLDIDAGTREAAQMLRACWSADSTRRVLLAASTHKGEDEIVLSAFKQLRQKIPDLLLVLVPRHPERFDTVYQLCLKRGFSVSRHSTESPDARTDIVLGDTLGELMIFYGACDVAFVGGSLIPTGGHNLIEPAAWGKPVVTGKYLHNFQEISRLLEKQRGCFIAANDSGLYNHLLELLEDPQKRNIAGANALMVADQNRGALKKMLALINGAISQ